MTIISYAQNLEDIIIWRALKNIENGFYIDVGANDPVVDSVTKLFYDRGWTGINIEPLQKHYLDLLAARKRDVNLNCAASDRNGEIEIWECEVRGWATADQSTIKMHESAGHKGVLHKVPVLTLNNICEKYVKSEIHFMKIDVEGFEKAVLDGMNFNVHRPWIMVIEATKPNSPEENYQVWEKNILDAKYQFVYADGLNRFYISEERGYLRDSFRYPPNVFDDFNTYAQAEADLRVESLVLKVRQQDQLLMEAEYKMNSLLNSASWRITAPFRYLRKYFK